MKKTRNEIEILKTHWCADPCWDIEMTEGFEEHRAELRAYRAQMEAEWGGRREADLQALEARLGVPNRKLALYIEGLERRLRAIEGRIDPSY